MATDIPTKIKMSVPYFQVPNDIFDSDIPLKDYEKLVYIYLCRCGNHGGQAFPSYDTIGKKCSISKRSAMRAVSNLIKLGLISKQVRPKGNGDNESNLYEVFVPSDTQSLGGSDSQSPYKELISEKETIYVSEKRLHALTGENVFLDFYLKTHEHFLGKNHVKVTPEQEKYINHCIAEIKDTYDIELETWQEEVVNHFENLPKSNNGNILAFLKASHRYFEINPENL
jgi:predicted transcriptional regulator